MRLVADLGRGKLVHEGSPVAMLVLVRSRRAHRLVWRRSQSGISGSIDERLMVLVEWEMVWRWRYGTARVRRSHRVVVQVCWIDQALDSLINFVKLRKGSKIYLN